jgi:hypothetical protein
MITSNNTKIFQIYFKPELRDQCDSKFVPLDNTANPRPELREWDVWDRFHEQRLEENLDLWGYVSWKFREKTNLSGQQVLDHIAKNPDYEVYLFNPCIVNEALFANSWEQGDLHHPDISGIGNKFFAKLGYETIDVKSMMLDNKRTVFANYVIGNRRFWEKFMTFSRSLFTEADKDPKFKEEVFGAGRSNYAHDHSLPNFTFLIERLIPTFLELEGFKVCPFIYTGATALPKYMPVLGDIQTLSTLKTLVNRYESAELYAVWNYYRTKILQQTPNILGLE